MQWKVVLALLAVLPLFGAAPRTKYALILEDAPAVKSLPKGAHRDAPELAAARKAIQNKQSVVRAEVQALGIHITGSADTLLNAIFVMAADSDVPKLRALPGVKYVAPLHRAHLMLDKAVLLIDAPNAWNVMGGIGNAGAGQKIAIIDTGIDQTHPAFQDPTLSMPSGYPLCDVPSDCAFTNNKVIVARSYVSQDSGGLNNASASFPDDYTPRDRVGHGTAVAMCAGGNTNAGPLATITGLAPHAYLGNYKIYGSPGINDGSSEDAIIMAFDDAFNDGMDVANLSSGYPPMSGPVDSGATCGLPAGQPCDPIAITVINAIDSQNMVVVIAAGNDGADTASTSGLLTLNSIDSPGYVPDAIAVGASENSRAFDSAVQIAGTNVPSNLATVAALPSADGPPPDGVLTATLVNGATYGDAYGCNGYAASSMGGDIVLIERGPASGPCTFDVKVNNAEIAGAVGVIVYDDTNETLFQMSGLGDTYIPAFSIGNTDGLNLVAYLQSTSGVTASLNGSSVVPYADPDVNQITSFSSRGPAISGNILKPDVVAPGEFIYMAAQDYDPNGELYDPSRYIVSQGTSFATPIVAGIAAMVRQNNPTFSALQVKSAIVNTATADTNDPYFGASGENPSGVLSAGGGKVEALMAITTTVTAVPSTLSFGALGSGSVSQTIPVTITNMGTTTANLSLAVNRRVVDPKTQLTLDVSALSLPATASQTVHITLSGTQPSPGIYEGAILITGGSVALHVPYLYLVGDGVPANAFALAGDEDPPGVVGDVVPDGAAVMKVIDQYGVPVAGAPVYWYAPDGGYIPAADSETDQNGIASAEAVLGPYPDTYYSFEAVVGNTGVGYVFEDPARLVPYIANNSVVNAASFTLGSGIAPGSWVAVFGTSLSDYTAGALYVPLPISINSVSVAFDAPNVSVPGPLGFVSAGQINVQVPWELAGQSSVQMKVNIEPVNGALATIPVATYSPAAFTVNNFAAAQDLSGNLISSANPAQPGKYISIYCNGLGPVTNQPASGAAALTSPLSETTTQPTVTIGGLPATVQFSGLAPGLVGVYQLNVLVPAGLGAGTQSVSISIGGTTAPVVSIPVG